ncbi:PEP/pyruvate-binding domain-containing protein [Nonomuraea sp. NPDC050536]|uniref:PEP/pyruvate-binding domain-containing protein n=1 Tax=Nonomuraea sp. NPDC050536 TaxID=3364366 RepID=UPI0037C6582B
MDVILKFADIDGSMLDRVGGKAANLGVLTRAGLPVPDGFCVATDAYRMVAHGIDVTDAATARKQILETEIPEALKTAITAELDGAPVAVRSSATAEDLPDASFAGQQDTYLNVIGPAEVLDAVRRCWASLWTDRAYAYRASNGIDHRTVSLAVVVQRMVQSETAGVMFTANPVTGTRRRAVIDAAPGLGEAVVSGAVNPDHFEVDLDSGRILARHLGDKRLAVRSLPGGGVEHVNGDEILVCPSTDPGWTPLFLTAGGLVMEMGGANSHGAVVAREYGIPAVVGVPRATDSIASGQTITVDGTSGTVIQ